MILRFPPYVDLRKPAELTWWQRLAQWINPPPKAEVFQIKNPRLQILMRRRERIERKAREL